jgi:TolB protein
MLVMKEVNLYLSLRNNNGFFIQPITYIINMSDNKLFLLLLLLCVIFITTCKKVEKVMMVVTGTVSDTTYFSAKVSGQIIDLGKGVKQYGHYYSTITNETTSGIMVKSADPPAIGEFTSQLTGLKSGTKYYVKSFISDGSTPEFGNEISFSTLNMPEILVVDNNDDIFSTKLGDNNLTPLISGTSLDVNPRINYSKTKIAFYSNRTGRWEIFLMNIDGTGTQQLTTIGVSGGQGNGGTGGMDWTPDGKILFIKAKKIYKMNVDGSSIAEVATAPSDYWADLRCSPSGDKIIAQTQGGWAYTITMYIMNIDGSNMSVFAPDLPGVQIIGCFSKDGVSFLYSYDISGHEESSGQSWDDQIISKKIDGSGITNLSINKLVGTDDFKPVFINDGSKILFLNNVVSSGTQRLWIMNADGSNRQPLFNNISLFSVDSK